MHNLVTTAEAADIVGRNRSTVTRWVQAGRLVPAITTAGGFHLFRLDDVEALADADRKGAA
ncbi:MAG: helix-turn-helix domain-containing protein [Caulobacteraceae bacterium]|nr:helix-turn-helix domain-containing protein [Caulobacteraceae bacterium]